MYRWAFSAFYPGFGCLMALLGIRQDRHQWLRVAGGLFYCGLVVYLFADTVSRPPSLVTYLCLAGYACLGFFAIGPGGPFAGGFQTRIHDGGISCGRVGPVVAWSELQRHEWHEDGNDFVLVIAYLSARPNRKDVEIMIPVPAEHRTQLEALLTNTPADAASAEPT